MSHHVPRTGGGFLKGFIFGSLLAVAAIFAAWLLLPGPPSETTAMTAGLVPGADVSPRIPAPETPARDMRTPAAAPDAASAVSAAPPESPDAGSSDTVALIGNDARTRPQVDAAPTLPGAEAALPDAGQRAAPSQASLGTDAVVRPPLPSAGQDRLAIPTMPSDQSVPTFPTTAAPNQAAVQQEGDSLEAGLLPDTEPSTNTVSSARLPSLQVEDSPDDAGAIDTQTARVGSRADAPDRANPPATAQTMTIVPISAPTAPRLPRATLTTPLSVLPDPVPLTLPGVDASPSPQPPKPEASDVAEGQDAETAQDTGATAVARLDSLAGSRETVGSLIQNREAPAAPLPASAEVRRGDGPAFVAHASEYVVESDLPRLAIILEDVGEDGIARDELVQLGTRVTFAIAPQRSDALQAQSAFRAADFEVVVLVPREGDMHIGASTEVRNVGRAIAEITRRVPEAVGFLDRPDGNIFRSTRLVDAVADTLKKSGHGFFVHEQFGVNRTIDVLTDRGVPAAPVLRVIDAQRNPDAIRRNLDRAALDASKSGGAVVFGRTYPETITALGIWSLSRSARGVVFTPLTSAVDARRP